MLRAEIFAELLQKLFLQFWHQTAKSYFAGITKIGSIAKIYSVKLILSQFFVCCCYGRAGVQYRPKKEVEIMVLPHNFI